MLYNTTTAAERSRMRESMGTMFHTIDLATQELHDLYSRFFDHAETKPQRSLQSHEVEYLESRLWAVEHSIDTALEEWAALMGDTRHRGQEYEAERARYLLEMRETEELIERAFSKLEGMPRGQAWHDLHTELHKAQELPDAEAIPILKALLDR